MLKTKVVATALKAENAQSQKPHVATAPRVGEVPPVTSFIAPLLGLGVGGLPVQFHADQVLLVKIVQVDAPAADPDAGLPRGDRKPMPTLNAAQVPPLKIRHRPLPGVAEGGFGLPSIGEPAPLVQRLPQPRGKR